MCGVCRLGPAETAAKAVMEVALVRENAANPHSRAKSAVPEEGLEPPTRGL